jgi:hypothetical protein
MTSLGARIGAGLSVGALVVATTACSTIVVGGSGSSSGSGGEAGGGPGDTLPTGACVAPDPSTPPGEPEWSVCWDNGSDVAVITHADGSARLHVASAPDYQSYLLSVDASSNILANRLLGVGKVGWGGGEDMVALDDGSTVMIGAYLTTVDFGGGPLPGSGGSGGNFLVKFDADLHHVWSRDPMSQGFVDQLHLAPMTDGALVAVGSAVDSPDFGGGPLGDDARGFVARFDGQGQHLWSAGFSWPVTGVARAADGAAWVLRTEFLPAEAPLSAIHLVKIDPSGATLSTTELGRYWHNQYPWDTHGIAPAPEGGAFVWAYFDSADLGANAAIDDRLVLARFDEGGQLVWSHEVSGKPTSSLSISATPIGEVLVSFLGTDLEIDGLSFGNCCGAVSVIAKFDPAGGLLWARAGTGGGVLSGRVAIDPAGHGYQTGWMPGSKQAYLSRLSP